MRKHLFVTVLTIIIFSIGCTSRGPESGNGALPDPRLASLLGDAAGEYREARAPRTFAFPADHGPHSGFRNEWWYLTGNLDSDTGRRFGFELTLFRFALAPAGEAQLASAWATRHVMIGHLAVTDAARNAFHVAERFARDAAGLAGARGDPARVWLYDWRLARQRGRDGWQLEAHDAASAIRLTLALAAAKPPVLQGEAGLSRKSAAPGNASYYYSVPRLRASGTLELGSERHAVTGLAWLDREWSSSALAADQPGWDWFALQLDDGYDLMYYQLRKSDGRRDPHSAGSWIGPDGGKLALDHDDIEIQVLGYWDSPAGGRYPSGWQLRIPRRQLELRVRPVLENQELDTWVRYWEGAVDVTGTRAAERVSGRGYVELTGYAGRSPAARP